jgi:hypothetical protein
MIRIFNSPSFQRGIMGASFAVGLVGVLGGVFLALRSDPASIAGLIGGAGMLAIAYLGFSRK